MVRIQPASGAQAKFVRVIPTVKCCANSLSVCLTPVCTHTHKNDRVCMLKILKSMSEFGGLPCGNRVLVGLGSAALAAAVACPG